MVIAEKGTGGYGRDKFGKKETAEPEGRQKQRERHLLKEKNITRVFHPPEQYVQVSDAAKRIPKSNRRTAGSRNGSQNNRQDGQRPES